MDKKMRFLSILLAMLMVLSSVAAVFAEGDTAPQAADDGMVTDQNADETTTEGDPDPAQIIEPEIVTPDGDGSTPAEVTPEEAVPEEAAPEEAAPEEELQDADGSAPEAPLAGTGVKIKIVCKYKGEDAVIKTVTKECSVGDVINAPTVVCAKNPTPAKITVDERTEYLVEYSPAAPAKVTTLKRHPSYKSIIITWNRVPGATKYVLQRSTQKDKGFKNLKTVNVTDTSKKSYTYTDKGAKQTVKPFSTARTYYYRIYAFSERGDRSLSRTISGTCVRPMYEKVTFKEGVSLTSHDGKSKTKYFRSGQTIIAQGFGGGKYKFWYDGYYFYASYVRVRNCIPMYQRNTDGIVGKAGHYSGKWAKQNYAADGSSSYKGIRYYDKTTAESFVNKYGKSSKTKYLIWVSTYTQHLYVFKGSKGKWKLYKDWECSTGAAKSPTPTGFDKAIQDKWRNHSGIDYWSPFQHANSIHGQRSSYVFGKPQSNGCVRNFDQNAKWLYYNCAIGTGLIVN